ncbi:MAG: hypothetical protein EZS28_026744 [Streblomastix strix]|uniref:Uncharacterized protein n=1 Tax=Streblomastix strix TaxID=222440 RepID=A0A5J4V5Z0_9EUKA|nr:MAG: hypothetical protein EZS28_026744 [Streblomastix strix]
MPTRSFKLLTDQNQFNDFIDKSVVSAEGEAIRPLFVEQNKSCSLNENRSTALAGFIQEEAPDVETRIYYFGFKDFSIVIIVKENDAMIECYFMHLHIFEEHCD